MELEIQRLETTVEITATFSEEIKTGEEENKHESRKKSPSDDRLLSLQNALLALAAAQEEQEKILAATKQEKTEKKTIEKTAEIEKKTKDITDVVDADEHKEKLKDKFKDSVLQITLDMDGFEKKHLEQYQQQLANYTRFLAEYLEGGRLALGRMQQSYTYTEEKKEIEMPKTEVQMMTYGETQYYVRSTVMNSLLGGGGANYIDPNSKDSWELWRVFQQNQIMSFLYTSQFRH